MREEFRYIGDYRVIDEIASGAHGRIYLVQHRISGRGAAIKVPHSSRVYSTDGRHKFLAEAQMLELLKHSHILPLIEYGVDDGLPFLVMLHAEGGSLRDRLEQNARQPLPLHEALSIIIHIGEALHYAHQQRVIHRDIKPENILFDAYGVALLADFSIAFFQIEETDQRTIVGTPAYMAPEQFRGYPDAKSDLYSLGCIAYELCTGRKPFAAHDFMTALIQHMSVRPEPPHQLNAQVPLHISKKIMKAMAREPENRYETVEEFIYDLQQPDRGLAQLPLVLPLPSRRSRPAKTIEQWILEGIALREHGQYRAALEAYDQALSIDPYCAEAYINKGNVFYHVGKWREAIAFYNQAIHLNPAMAQAYNNKGLALQRCHYYRKALRAHEQAIKLQPGFASAYGEKGNALYKLGRFWQAVNAYRQALRLEPDNCLFHENLGKAYERVGQLRKAREAYERARRLGCYMV